MTEPPHLRTEEVLAFVLSKGAQGCSAQDVASGVFATESGLSDPTCLRYARRSIDALMDEGWLEEVSDQVGARHRCYRERRPQGEA